MSTITYANIQPVTEADFIRRDRQVLESSSIMTHDSVTHYCDSDYKSSDEDEQSDLEDEELSKIDKDLRSFRKDEWMDMSDYETQLRSNYMPLQGSQVTAVHLSYKERHSAQVILSSERLCKWFYPHLRQLEVEGFLHARRNGIWDCPDYGDCRVHADN
ncbi:hypothetical protein IW142_000637 [Coemansia sp. RSA 564]|nr:hypothetical protein IW142_000637 [Coemansia sp. RSA 564]KAJ2410319.1 hypothetical protein J3F80_000668 [Coemansia sp. RSA 2526]KAJ2835962.1 hypothetical protein J3B01_003172 [Coemansia erecta]